MTKVPRSLMHINAPQVKRLLRLHHLPSAIPANFAGSCPMQTISSQCGQNPWYGRVLGWVAHVELNHHPTSMFKIETSQSNSCNINLLHQPELWASTH